MKVLAANLGPITDLEVIKALEQRGADKDWARKKQVPSERQVYAALKQRHPQQTTTEQLSSLLTDLKGLGLTRGEQLQIVNLKPTAPVVVHLIVEDCESRLTAAQVDELLAGVERHLCCCQVHHARQSASTCLL
ncbi:g2003 [Coccomyxa viridis]|uniref:DNA-directed RNA polymerase III subunit RPC9 n=1 Tax=Coccomyxa viridis TaxID=1274662 RepID=A0ABP1FJB8_9CHLO